MKETQAEIGKQAKEIIADIKKLTWSSIKLTRRQYRGAIKTYATETNALIPLFFYIDEVFIVEDEVGIFGVQDLKYSLQDKTNVNLEATGQIEGIKIVAYIDTTGKVEVREDVLDYLGINRPEVVKDIKKRIKKLNQLKAEVEVEF